MASFLSISRLIPSFSLRAMSTTSSIPCFNTVAGYREWRRKARDDKKSVGFVATMGALHDGHLSLVRRSLEQNDLTVLSIFRSGLASQQSFALPDGSVRTVSAVFVPTVTEMYPSGISQDVSHQKGTFIEVKGYGEQMEGKSRPTFFRGVATVVTKLFNAIEPTQTYFGQKDIQQALLLRRMCRDLLMSHPTPENLHIVPTARDSSDGLALSSRNTYLSAEGRTVAPTLYSALRAAKAAWDAGSTKQECLQQAIDLVHEKAAQAAPRVDVKLDYIQFNDSDTFEELEDGTRALKDEDASPVILSGAMWVDKTRLIDNIILGNDNKIWG
ncbi:Pantoate-beta-alanine ligase [Mucidula mucida]|nr:Pantoate-beta-alanine ligase [Mucidula mucida]